VIRHNKNKSCA